MTQRSVNDDYAVGDLVTRDGSDLHLVTDLTEDGFVGDFLCVQAPDTGWTAVGDTEINLARRYKFVRTPPPAAPPKKQTPNLVFTSGSADPLHVDAADRRFMVALKEDKK